MKLITSAQNEQLKHLFRLLTQAKARRESGETVLEGVHLLQTYLQSGGTPKQVYLPEKKQQHPEIQEITAQLDEGLITWVGNEALSKARPKSASPYRSQRLPPIRQNISTESPPKTAYPW